MKNQKNPMATYLAFAGFFAISFVVASLQIASADAQGPRDQLQSELVQIHRLIDQKSPLSTRKTLASIKDEDLVAANRIHESESELRKMFDEASSLSANKKTLPLPENCVVLEWLGDRVKMPHKSYTIFFSFTQTSGGRTDRLNKEPLLLFDETQTQIDTDWIGLDLKVRQNGLTGEIEDVTLVEIRLRKTLMGAIIDSLSFHNRSLAEPLDYSGRWALRFRATNKEVLMLERLYSGYLFSSQTEKKLITRYDQAMEFVAQRLFWNETWKTSTASRFINSLLIYQSKAPGMAEPFAPFLYSIRERQSQTGLLELQKIRASKRTPSFDMEVVERVFHRLGGRETQTESPIEFSEIENDVRLAVQQLKLVERYGPETSTLALRLLDLMGEYLYDHYLIGKIQRSQDSGALNVSWLSNPLLSIFSPWPHYWNSIKNPPSSGQARVELFRRIGVQIHR